MKIIEIGALLLQWWFLCGIVGVMLFYGAFAVNYFRQPKRGLEYMNLTNMSIAVLTGPMCLYYGIKVSATLVGILMGFDLDDMLVDEENEDGDE